MTSHNTLQSSMALVSFAKRLHQSFTLTFHTQMYHSGHPDQSVKQNNKRKLKTIDITEEEEETEWNQCIRSNKCVYTVLQLFTFRKGPHQFSGTFVCPTVLTSPSNSVLCLISMPSSHQTQGTVWQWNQGSVCSCTNCMFCPNVVRQRLIVDEGLQYYSSAIMLAECSHYHIW